MKLKLINKILLSTLLLANFSNVSVLADESSVSNSDGASTAATDVTATSLETTDGVAEVAQAPSTPVPATSVAEAPASSIVEAVPSSAPVNPVVPTTEVPSSAPTSEVSQPSPVAPEASTTPTPETSTSAAPAPAPTESQAPAESQAPSTSSPSTSSSSSPSSSSTSASKADKEKETGLEGSKTEAEEATFNVVVNVSTSEFISKIGEEARELGQKYNIYASVMIAQALLESGSGSSGLANAPYYNLFGIKGAYLGASVSMKTQEDDGSGKLYTISAAFRKYPDYHASLEDYAKLIRTSTYRNVWKENAATYQDATKALTGLYATDTSYYKKLNALIEAYNLTQYDELTAEAAEKAKSSKTLLDLYPTAEFPDYDGTAYVGSERYTDENLKYVYNRVHQLGGHIQSNLYEATNWAISSKLQGYTVKKAPTAGTVVVAMNNQIDNSEGGFVGFVEKVYSSGAILVSEYGQIKDGRLSYRVIDTDQAQQLSYISPQVEISEKEYQATVTG